jgi:hypothetical protein
LLAIISGYRLSKLSGRDFEVVWNITGGEVPCNFTDLFEEPDFKITSDVVEKKWDTPLDIHKKNDISIWATKPFDNNWRVPKDDDLSAYCHILKPKKFILDEVENFISLHGPPPLGVHLRRQGVHLIDNCNVPIIAYINKKLKENEKGKIFVSTDCQETLNIFNVIYWGNMVYYDNNTFNRTSLKDMEVALINILLLSRCIFIVRSGLSGFSYLASIINKTPNLIL